MKFHLVATTLIVAMATSSMAKLLTAEYIQSINAKQTTWTAALNFPETPVEELKTRLTGTFTPNVTNVPSKVYKINAASIPESFDSRDKWPQCESIGEIRNQGSCGACWAFAGSEIMTDRLCIATNGAQKFKFSPEHIATCCTECGSCKGGVMESALNYYVQSGVVSGGDVNSNEGCQPYDALAYNTGETPSCASYCTNPSYRVSFEQDKHYGANFYLVSGQNVRQIQTEIMTNGPVETYMEVYSDFYSYYNGVYVNTEGDNPGGHAVKIIGWGTENGTPYWLVANSWGAQWADLGGYFKIIRGQNNCRIEEFVFASLPKL